MTMIRIGDDLSALPAAPAAAGANAQTRDRLGQQDFLTLLTAQLRNQDPLNPMQNTEFLGQMAQFSTVAGIDRLHDGLQGLGAGMRDMRLGMASTLIGQSVLVPGATVYPDGQGAFRGMTQLESPAEDVQVSFSDARTGALLHRQSLGPQPAGAVSFGWEAAPPDLVAARQPLRVSVLATTDGRAEDLPAQVYARVLSATLGRGQDDITLDVEGFGILHGLEVETIR